MNITKEVEAYVRAHSSIMDCMKTGLLNYSSLSRKILADLSLPKNSFDAVLIACRRLAGKLKGEEAAENRIRKIVEASKLEIHNKVCAVVLEKAGYLDDVLELEKRIKRKGESFYLVEGTSSITLIFSEDFLEEARKGFKLQILKINRNLAQVIVRSPKEIETTPGVIAYIYSLLANAGINVAETASCWTDTLFLVDEKDVAKVIEAFNVK